MCCISYLFTRSFMKSFIQIDLDAEFGASVSPCVCAHPCASLHMCVRAVKPEEDQQSQKNCMSPGFTFYWCVSSSCPLHPIKASCVALLYVSKNPETHIISSDSVTAKNFPLGGERGKKNFPLVFPSETLKSVQTKELKKKVLKTSMSTQSSITFLWVRALENILKSRSSLVSALMRCYLGWLTRLQRTELFLQLTPPVKCASKLHGPTWVACRPHCRYHQSPYCNIRNSDPFPRTVCKYTWNYYYFSWFLQMFSEKGFHVFCFFNSELE